MTDSFAFTMGVEGKSAIPAAVTALLDGTWRQALIDGRHDEPVMVDEAAPGPRFPCLMTDIESMSTHNSRALLPSAAFTPFRLTPEGPEFGTPLLLIFDLAEQLIAGRRVDCSTQEFWGRQKPKASEHFADPLYEGRNGVAPRRCSVRDLHWLLSDFMAANCEPKAEVYSQGIVFDLGNLTDLMADHGGPPPWEYWAATDLRSLRRKMPKLRTRPPVEAHAADHDPVHDCQKQIWALWEIATDEMLGVAPQAVTA